MRKFYFEPILLGLVWRIQRRRFLFPPGLSYLPNFSFPPFVFLFLPLLFFPNFLFFYPGLFGRYSNFPLFFPALFAGWTKHPLHILKYFPEELFWLYTFQYFSTQYNRLRLKPPPQKWRLLKSKQASAKNLWLSYFFCRWAESNRRAIRFSNQFYGSSLLVLFALKVLSKPNLCAYIL